MDIHLNIPRWYWASMIHENIPAANTVFLARRIRVAGLFFSGVVIEHFSPTSILIPGAFP